MIFCIVYVFSIFKYLAFAMKNNIFDIRDFGAIGDNQTLNTLAIQNAIDACHNAGGGRVVIENGQYVSGTISLKSYVELHIERNAVLVGSKEIEDYPENNVKHVNTSMLPRGRNACFILADECESIAITGMGKIYCSGEKFVEKAEHYYMPYKRVDKPTPPRVVFFTGCRNVKLEDTFYVNEVAGWTFWIHDCEYVNISKLKVECNLDMPNNDGIHINSSRNVCVSDCNLTCSDDTLVVRANNASLQERKVCENITITNCNLHSHAAGIRIGWLNDGTIRNCTFSDLTMTDCTTGVSISLPINESSERWPDQGVEATKIENLNFNNIVMQKGYDSLILINVGNHENTHCAGIKGLYFNNIHATGFRMPHIVGRNDVILQDIIFSNCTFEQLSFEDVNDGKNHGSLFHHDIIPHPLTIKHANVAFNNTTFKTIG